MKLHEQVKHQAAVIKQLKSNVSDVLDYVSSLKFYGHNMVNTADILLLIREGQRDLLTIEDQS